LLHAIMTESTDIQSSPPEATLQHLLGSWRTPVFEAWADAGLLD
jgi:hypothetical protein